MGFWWISYRLVEKCPPVFYFYKETKNRNSCLPTSASPSSRNHRRSPPSNPPIPRRKPLLQNGHLMFPLDLDRLKSEKDLTVASGVWLDMILSSILGQLIFASTIIAQSSSGRRAVTTSNGASSFNNDTVGGTARSTPSTRVPSLVSSAGTVAPIVETSFSSLVESTTFPSSTTLPVAVVPSATTTVTSYVARTMIVDGTQTISTQTVVDQVIVDIFGLSSHGAVVTQTTTFSTVPQASDTLSDPSASASVTTSTSTPATVINLDSTASQTPSPTESTRPSAPILSTSAVTLVVDDQGRPVTDSARQTGRSTSTRMIIVTESPPQTAQTTTAQQQDPQLAGTSSGVTLVFDFRLTAFFFISCTLIILLV